MTCIVAVKDGNNIWMGSDSFVGTSHGTKHQIKNSKTYTETLACGTRLIFGFCGYLKTKDIIQFTKKPSIDIIGEVNYLDLKEYIITKLIPSISSSLENYGFLKREDSIASMNDSSFLLGIKPVNGEAQIFKIEECLQICSYSTDYYSIGSGAEYAEGALSVLYNEVFHDTISPDRIIKIALKAASLHNAYVMEPFDIQHI